MSPRFTLRRRYFAAAAMPPLIADYFAYVVISCRVTDSYFA